MALSDRSLFIALALLTGLSTVFVSGCNGCSGLPDEFIRDDDDTPADDDDTGLPDDDDVVDDDDTAQQEAPVLKVTGPPAPVEIADLFAIQFTIDDADSQRFFVDVTFETDQSADTSATLVEGNPWDGDSGNVPTVEFPGEITWDTLIDIPTIAEGVRLRLCPTDAEGNEGVCELYPPEDEDPIRVFNSPPPTSGELCQPGDLEELEFASGDALIALSDGVCLNYDAPQAPNGTPTDFSAQFLVLLLNTGSDAATYEITWATDPDELDLGGDDDDTAPDDDDSLGDDDDSANPYVEAPMASRFAGTPRFANRRWERPTFPVDKRPLPSARNADASRLGDDLPGIELEASTCTSDLDVSDVNTDVQPFKMRTGLTDEAAERETVGATLRALGTNVAVYVDNSTPLDVDYQCDGVIDVVSSQPASGFDNCDLQDVVDVIDANIAPTLANLYGDLSDVDGNCRVTVLISHRLNAMTAELDLPYMLRSLAEPEVDLWAEDQSLNPNTNEQEIIYVYAPDPLEIFNPNVRVRLDNYLSFELAGQIAYSWQKLISYAVHRQVGKVLLQPDNPEHVAKPPAEEDWLDDGMGWLAADMTGFGAVIYRDAWIYLDRPHLSPLRYNNTLENFEDRGGQYLFVRYLVDLFGPGVIWEILHASTDDGNGDPVPTQGVDSILSATGEEEFNPLALEWVAAMAVSGRLNAAVPPTQLVADSDVRQYNAPTSVVVPAPATPVTGELYGANGFQQGIQVRGFNHVYIDGTNPAGPAQVVYLPPYGTSPQPLYRMDNIDPQVFHPERAFYGSVAGLHGAAAILVSGLTQPMNFLLIETSSEHLLGMVIRLNDYHPYPDIGQPSIPVTVENDASAAFTTSIDLGILDPAGSERRVIGGISPGVTVTLTPVEPAPAAGDDDDATPPATDDDDVEPEEVTIADVDLYHLHLDSTQRIGVWVDRRYSDAQGGASMTDPFIAVAPADDVPNVADYAQWNFGPSPADGPCPDASLYQWPNTIPPWISAQGHLLPQPVLAEDYEILVAGDGDWAPGELECLYDHDQDGIPDEAEPVPATLAEQILQRQAEHLVLDPTYYQASPGFGDPPWFFPTDRPWFGASFIDYDSNEDPDDDLASFNGSYGIGGRNLAEGEEAVWQGLLPAGDYTIIVGDGSEGTGPYDMSVRVLPN